MSAEISPRLESSWKHALSAEFAKPYFSQLKSFLLQEKRQHRVYPAGSKIFHAFDLTPLNQVKVVILGQDPYHGPAQAHGLAFSVLPGVSLPPSLQNIFKELAQDLAIPQPQRGDLTPWAKQGVLLLNTCLTVRAHQAHSHRSAGWEIFTDSVIQTVSSCRDHVVFMLWGSPAKSKMSLINTDKHTVLCAPHPSPLSAHRGFFGCKHFSKANAALSAHHQTPIIWALSE